MYLERHIKITFNFTAPYTLAQVRNFITNTTWPKIRDALSARIQNNFTNFSVDKKLKIEETNGRFYVYPKTIFKGDTELTKAQLVPGLQNAIDDIRAIIVSDLSARGVTSINWHIHYADGRCEDEIQAL